MRANVAATTIGTAAIIVNGAAIADPTAVLGIRETATLETTIRIRVTASSSSAIPNCTTPFIIVQFLAHFWHGFEVDNSGFDLLKSIENTRILWGWRGVGLIVGAFVLTRSIVILLAVASQEALFISCNCLRAWNISCSGSVGALVGGVSVGVVVVVVLTNLNFGIEIGRNDL